MNPLLQIYRERRENYKKKFITKSVFGVALGAIDNLNESAENQVLNNQKSDFLSVLEAVEKMVGGEKEIYEKVLLKATTPCNKTIYEEKIETCDDLLSFLSEAKEEINKEI